MCNNLKNQSNFALKYILRAEEIAEIVQTLAEEINRDYANRDVVALGILNGAFVFMADLLRKLSVNVSVDFVQLSSYGAGTKSSGEIKFLKQPRQNLSGRHVLIVEDIIDTGLTLKYLTEFLLSRGAASVKSCVFVDKKCCRTTPFDADYVGYTAEDRFLVGYGLDYDEQYRQLPDLCELLLDE